MGAGFHGGFGETHGTKQNNFPIKSSKDIMGYSQSDSRAFHKNVVDSLIGKVPSKSEITPFGIKHTYNTKLKGINSQYISATVVVVIQKDNNRITYKIVTVYPDKKESKL